MFSVLFNLAIRALLIPILTITALQRFGWFDSKLTVLGVVGIYTIITLPLIIWQAIRILPNLALVRVNRTFMLVLTIILEVISIIGWWIYFVMINR